MATTPLSKEQQIQDDQYQFPYHFIPVSENGNYSPAKYWYWGFNYLGGMKVLIDRLAQIPWQSLIDVGCGDGRFIKEVSLVYPDKKLVGVDYSERAIALARVMNRDQDYRLQNILTDPISERFDIVTSIETIEHIPIPDVPRFIEGMADLLNPGGWLMLTVPHLNLPLEDKHYQHFTSAMLNEVLSPFFSNITYIPLEPQHPVFNLIAQLMGGKGEHYVITNKAINRWFYQLFLKHHLYAQTEQNCWRIAAFCTKK